MTDAPGWFEVRAVVRCDPDTLAAARAWLDDSGMAEVARIDVLALDDDLRRWDGTRPPGVVAPHEAAAAYLGEPEPAHPTHPVFDRLRSGLHLHEQ